MAQHHPVAPKMAPKNQPQTTPQVDDVRAALLHIAEVAAAFEGRGLDVRARRSTDSDVALLAGVTLLAQKHLAEQRRSQRNALLKMIMGEAAAKMAGYRKERLESYALEQGMRASLRALGFSPTQAELETLVPDDADLDPNNRDPESVKALRGPSEAAKHGLARAVGLSTGTIAEAKRRDDRVLRSSFGRVVSPMSRRDYLIELSNLADEPEPVALAALADMNESAGSALDQALGSLAHETLTERWVVHAICLDEQAAPELREIRRTFDDKVKERCAVLHLVAAILAGLPVEQDLYGHCRSYVSGLAASIAEVVLLLALALEKSDVRSAEELRLRLETVVKIDLLERTHERWRQRGSQFGVDAM
jgi:hypothetical protein